MITIDCMMNGCIQRNALANLDKIGLKPIVILWKTGNPHFCCDSEKVTLFPSGVR
jgi:hypothetical protein